MPRKKKPIDEKLVQALAAIGCTVSEIAMVVDCSKDTLERRFADALNKGREMMKVSIRRLQLKAAEAGNVTMLIWLGKQYLGQRDKQEINVSEIDAAIESELEALRPRGEGSDAAKTQDRATLIN